jgi:hypothetical protein
VPTSRAARHIRGVFARTAWAHWWHRLGWYLLGLEEVGNSEAITKALETATPNAWVLESGLWTV